MGRVSRLRGPSARLLVPLHLLLVGLGVAGLVAHALEAGPDYLGDASAVLISTVYTWILAARTGGRSAVFAAVALGMGGAAVLLDYDTLRSGAAALTASVGAVLGVMTTVPAVKFTSAVREVAFALAIAAVGAGAAVGFQPVIDVARFEYTTLGLSFALVLALVYRLGAGLHGLGTRGLVAVVGGSLGLGVALAYAELLRRYGTPSLIESALDSVTWTRDHLGAFPRPLQTLLGIPALVWGSHQRARRRQGWWVTAFGVAATAPVAHLVVNPALTWSDIGLTEAYSIVVGLLLGYLVIRLDLVLTGSRGRRGRRAEEAGAIRPEPSRTRALF